MKFNPIWNSFAAGELSPRFYSRSDVKPWRNGAARVQNLIATSHGPVLRRGGFEYLGKSTATQAKVYGYPHLVDQGYFICISEAEIHIFNASADKDPPVLEQTLPAVWPVDRIYNIQGAVVPGETAVYFAQPQTNTQELIFDPNAAVGSQWSIADITFVDKPADWTGTNWPGAITFYQGRLWLGGTDTSPATLWASEAGEFKTFTPAGGTPTDKDAIEVTLARPGRILWLAPAQNLMVGTGNGEHVISAQQQAVTTTDIDVQQQSAYGSLDTQPEMLGNVTLYVSPDGRKVRDVGYRWEENTWLSRDITFISEHITKENQLREVTWMQNPDNLLWGVTRAGTALCCTYERHYDIQGWHRHDTQGAFESLHSIDVEGTSLLMGAFKRESGDIYYEFYRREVYLDSHVILATPGASISVPHLSGKTVTVLVDGATHPPVVLDGSGNGTLQYTGDVVQVGLSYLPKLTTLPMDYTPEEQGTSQHFMKRWNKTYLRVLESGRPLINGKRPPNRTPATPMGTPEPIVTEDIRVSNLHWDRLAQLTIEQDLPLPLEIAGIFGELGQDQLS